MNLRDTFNSVISDYDYARPLYPKELFDDITLFSNLKQNSNILEVGAGTGQSTDHYIRGGFNLTALEIGLDQVEFLKQKYPNVHVECIPFEDYECETNSFDLIFSATAFHWINAEIGYPKAYELLKCNGTMSVFWHMSSITYLNGSIHNGLNAIKKIYMPNESLGYDEQGLLEIKEMRIRQIQIGGRFNNPEYREYKWIDNYDADKYVALLNTYSNVQILEEITRKKYLAEIYKYINDNGGTVEIPQCVCLYMVKKKI